MKTNTGGGHSVTSQKGGGQSERDPKKERNKTKKANLNKSHLDDSKSTTRLTNVDPPDIQLTRSATSGALM